MARIYHTAHKRAKRRNLVRNLLTELLIHDSVIVTRDFKKTVKKEFDHLITLAKKNTLNHYRQALNLVRKSQKTTDKKFIITKLKTLAQKYAGRSGGYLTSAILPNRRGDNATTYFLKLVS